MNEEKKNIVTNYLGSLRCPRRDMKDSKERRREEQYDRLLWDQAVLWAIRRRTMNEQN